MLPLNYDSIAFSDDQKSSFGLIALFKFSRNTRDDKLPAGTPPSRKTAKSRNPDNLRSADYGIRINAGSHLKRCTPSCGALSVTSTMFCA